mmetsp:Transcript_16599/g.35647  ORF Transcript_16599/g.35647 Transcript_16599/m.35647 type:complete len:363 (+) Transcript_16599:473-1561(+)
MLVLTLLVLQSPVIARSSTRSAELLNNMNWEASLDFVETADSRRRRNAHNLELRLRAEGDARWSNACNDVEVPTAAGVVRVNLWQATAKSKGVQLEDSACMGRKMQSSSSWMQPSSSRSAADTLAASTSADASTAYASYSRLPSRTPPVPRRVAKQPDDPDAHRSGSRPRLNSCTPPRHRRPSSETGIAAGSSLTHRLSSKSPGALRRMLTRSSATSGELTADRDDHAEVDVSERELGLSDDAQKLAHARIVAAAKVQEDKKTAERRIRHMWSSDASAKEQPGLKAELAKLEATSRAMLVLREYELQLEFQKSRNEPAPSGWSQGSGSSLRAANPAAAPPRCLVAQADPLSTGLPNDEAYIA